jgi:uncharacterized protein
VTLLYPELPEAARPDWPPWMAPAAFFSAMGALFFLLPALPIILVGVFSETLAAVSLLILILIQDAALMGAAILFATRRVRPAPWHFGVRPSRLWPTIGWAVLGFGVLIGIEVGWFELFEVDEVEGEDLGEGNPLAAVIVAVAAIVVAPVSEEFFFRAFFYRALRTRLGVWSASLIDGVVFASVHVQYYTEPLVLPVIFTTGVGLCLVYERTGSLFAVIAIHAAFNTVASLGASPVAAIVVGVLVLLACLLVPRRLQPTPSPVRV